MTGIASPVSVLSSQSQFSVLSLSSQKRKPRVHDSQESFALVPFVSFVVSLGAYLLREFISCEEEAQLESCGILRVRSVHRVSLDALRMLLADRPGFGVCGIRRAHQLAPVGDRVFLLQCHDHNRAGGHELNKRVVERLTNVYSIEAARLRLLEVQHLDPDDPESLLFDRLNDV